MDDGQSTTGWTELDTKLGDISPLTQRFRFVVGFADRKQMTVFAANILGRMPSISRHATIQFGICCDSVESTYQRRWHRASIESEEPLGAISHVMLCILGTDKMYLGDIKGDLADISL